MTIMENDDSPYVITIPLNNGGDDDTIAEEDDDTIAVAEEEDSPLLLPLRPKDTFYYTQTPEIICKPCYILVVMILFFLVAFTFFVLFDDPNYQVDSLSISSFNIDVYESQITAFWNITFSARNTDGVSFNLLDYGDVHVSVFYKDEILSLACIGPLHYGPWHKTKLFNANPVALTTRIDEKVAKAIANDWERGSVFFTLRLKNLAPKLDVLCENVNVAFANSSTTGSMLDQYTPCS
ncbi:hypothetical protein COLO4_22664 [Corchorus olitorius]|uniref:Late embryogenesis abundant protein, LEA-14 n=1 Tax=Corchorus olitorius TaxID=93759 RepID=A0A1R3IKP9_9ROSI|nr:hypothetical protein COLO4_22664 [Corchorus olitorius]